MNERSISSARPSRHASASVKSHIADLQVLGFSSYEARVYVALLHTNPATAYELSKVADIPRANVYGALTSLSTKMAVQLIGQRPARYIPVDPGDLMRRIARETSGRCDEVAAKLSKLDTTESHHYVLDIAGRKHIQAKTNEIIASARDRIYLKASQDVLEPHRAALCDAAEHGVRVFIVLFGDDPDRYRVGPSVTVHLHEGDGERRGVADNLLTIAADGTQALTANVSGDFYGVHTQSPPVVSMAETVIRHDLYLAEFFTALRPEIEANFGPRLSELRARFYAPQEYDRFRATFEREDAIEPEPGIGDAPDNALAGASAAGAGNGGRGRSG
ncbi:TrmB family transcriptional regulator [Pelagibius sp.]|uniref:TrmB family transcriptional regulator n=1 Tax=Pelagibius sp. TaxID=1931238 RepID=UPI003BB0D0EE